MLLEAINTANPVKIRFNDEDVMTGIFKSPVSESVNVTRLGIEGDTIVDTLFHGGVDQAIYIYHAEDYDWWSAELGRTIDHGTFGENLTVSGLAGIPWVIGDRIRINDVVLEISAPRTPCFKLAVRMNDNSFVKKFAQAVRPGAYARVITEGVIKAGDAIEIDRTAMDYATVNEVFSIWHSKDKPSHLLKKALESPVANMHRQQLQGWYDAL
jgi:MOSC domain-containing protein YiiM